ncbi:hypothetical protein PMIN06_008747 [Paraphaeosphaeria minitans]
MRYSYRTLKRNSSTSISRLCPAPAIRPLATALLPTLYNTAIMFAHLHTASPRLPSTYPSMEYPLNFLFCPLERFDSYPYATTGQVQQSKTTPSNPPLEEEGNLQ